MSEKNIPKAGGISRSENDKVTQVCADSRTPQMDPPLPVWDAFSQSLHQLGIVPDAQMDVNPKVDFPPELPSHFPVKFCENSGSELPPASELFGGSLSFCQSWLSPITITTIGSSPASDAQSDQRCKFFLAFTGHVFDVEAMAFEFYEDKMEFENYDLVINMPGQESILTTESFDFFLDRVHKDGQSNIGVEENGPSDSEKEEEYEFIEEKLEFEEHDLAINMPGQDSILNADNFSLMCLKLIAWMAVNSGEGSADMKPCSDTQCIKERSLEAVCKENDVLEACYAESNTDSPASYLTLGSKTVVGQSSTQDSLTEGVVEEENVMPVDAGTKNADTNSFEKTQSVKRCSLEACIGNDVLGACHEENNTDIPASFTLGSGTASQKSSTHDLNEELSEGNSMLAESAFKEISRVLPVQVTPKRTETAMDQSPTHDSLDEGTSKGNSTPVKSALEAASRVVPVQATPELSEKASFPYQVVRENRPVQSEQDNVSSDSVRATTHVNSHVKKRKNILIGFICAKIVKVFVTKFLLL